ncbi:MAG: aldo/keto reductase, partial [Xenococcaceae cyanobacterium MO_207.B15]|nr:aldo/keto reductase [Xenococcaceae cyanobacterium MO_207.B15]
PHLSISLLKGETDRSPLQGELRGWGDTIVSLLVGGIIGRWTLVIWLDPITQCLSFAEIASRHKATSTQIALNWLLRQNNIISIPKATNPNHVRENRAALDINLTEEDIKEIDRAFKPPSRKMSLAIR